MNGKLNRRDFLRLSGLTTAGVVLAACGAAETPATSGGGEATAPAAPA
ncbi:MAG: twin-arginine translocation signal domain-containing protein [Caldilineaceae bacterium]